MKKLILLLAFVPLAAFSEPVVNDYSEKQIDANALSLKVLSGWGAINLITGLIQRPIYSENHERRYFYEMNSIYGSINLGIGILGWVLNERERDETGLGSKELLKRGLRYERIYLVNAGIDLGMILLGVALQNKVDPDAQKSARWEGYGQAFVMQGFFLLFLDSILAIRHSGLNDDAIASQTFVLAPMKEGGLALSFRF